MVKNIKNIYSKKIITSSRLAKIIGKRPRKKKVVLCHGNFDVVHPGHIRHLLYGKSKGELLVLQLTNLLKKEFIGLLFQRICGH